MTTDVKVDIPTKKDPQVVYFPSHVSWSPQMKFQDWLFLRSILRDKGVFELAKSYSTNLCNQPVDQPPAEHLSKMHYCLLDSARLQGLETEGTSHHYPCKLDLSAQMTQFRIVDVSQITSAEILYQFLEEGKLKIASTTPGLVYYDRLARVFAVAIPDKTKEGLELICTPVPASMAVLAPFLACKTVQLDVAKNVDKSMQAGCDDRCIVG